MSTSEVSQTTNYAMYQFPIKCEDGNTEEACQEDLDGLCAYISENGAMFQIT